MIALSRLLDLSHSKSKLHEELVDHETLLEKAQATVVGTRTRMYDVEGVTEASAFDEDFEEILDDLATFVDCLMDLTPALEHPATDQDFQSRQTRPTESFNVSSALAANYCRKIRDRFADLDVKLLERLGEANALRTQRIQQRLRPSIEVVKEELGLDVDPESEPMFSETGYKFTETTKSTYQATRPSESIFDRPVRNMEDVGIADILSQATFASFSTTSSSKGQGRPRVPPLPVEAGSRETFRCVACGNELLAMRTRRA